MVQLIVKKDDVQISNTIWHTELEAEQYYFLNLKDDETTREILPTEDVSNG